MNENNSLKEYIQKQKRNTIALLILSIIVLLAAIAGLLLIPDSYLQGICAFLGLSAIIIASSLISELQRLNEYKE